MTSGIIPSHKQTESTHHRLFELVKTALIKFFVSPYATVCDLYCGRVTDEEKWDEAQIGHYIGIDVAASGVDEIREAWESQRKSYTSQFFVLDPSIENIELKSEDKENMADIVCCMQHLQFCFDTEERVRRLLHNVSTLLKPGGYFLVLLQIHLLYGFRFREKYLLKFANDISAESHCLVHFPSLIRLAREAGLEYVEIQNLTDFYDDNRAQFAGMLLDAGHNLVDSRGDFYLERLYTTFIFQKPDPDIAPPLMTPLLHDGNHNHDEREWQEIGGRDEEKTVQTESTIGLGKITEQKGILGPGPAELRFTEAL